MNPVDPKFVQSIVENYGYGSEEGVKHQTQKEAEDSCEKHNKEMKDFGMPKNVGNAYKAPENPQPREQSLNDDQSKSDELTENVEKGYPEMGIKGGTNAAKKEAKKRKYKKKQMLQDDGGLVGNQDELDVDDDGEIEGEDLAKLRAGKKKEVAMESRVEALEESLATLLTSLKSLISEGYGKKMNEAEGPTDKELKDIEKREHHKTAVGAQGAAAEGGDEVPVGKRGSGETAKLSHLLKGVKPNSAKAKELKMKARGHKLTKKQMNTGLKKRKQMTKQEINQAVQDNK